MLYYYFSRRNCIYNQYYDTANVIGGTRHLPSYNPASAKEGKFSAILSGESKLKGVS